MILDTMGQTPSEESPCRNPKGTLLPCPLIPDQLVGGNHFSGPEHTLFLSWWLYA